MKGTRMKRLEGLKSACNWPVMYYEESGKTASRLCGEKVKDAKIPLKEMTRHPGGKAEDYLKFQWSSNHWIMKGERNKDAKARRENVSQ